MESYMTSGYIFRRNLDDRYGAHGIQGHCLALGLGLFRHNSSFSTRTRTRTHIHLDPQLRSSIPVYRRNKGL